MEGSARDPVVAIHVLPRREPLGELEVTLTQLDQQVSNPSCVTQAASRRQSSGTWCRRKGAYSPHIRAIRPEDGGSTHVWNVGLILKAEALKNWTKS
jgi:hypothetical protein